MSASLHFISDLDPHKLIEAADYFNVSNSNARDILSAMGFDPYFEDSDKITIDDLIRSATLYLSGPLREYTERARPMRQEGNHIYCERRANYLSEKIINIHALAAAAKEHGATHAYFA